MNILINAFADEKSFEIRSHGYENLTIPDSLKLEDVKLVEADENTLAIKPTGVEADNVTLVNQSQKYIICDEIGLVPISGMKYTAELSVIMLRGGKMLVHLMNGVLAVKVGDKLTGVFAGEEFANVMVRADRLNWVSAQRLQGAIVASAESKRKEERSDFDNLFYRYTFDFEQFVQVGTIDSDDFYFTLIKDKAIDISHGFIAGKLKAIEDDRAKKKYALERAEFLDSMYKSAVACNYDNTGALVDSSAN